MNEQKKKSVEIEPFHAAKNPEIFGFSPTASAEQNVIALQAAVSGGGLIVIHTPGTYELNDTILLDSDTKLICTSGVVFKKVAPYCNVLLNRGALTKEYNEDITIDGLEICVNGFEAEPSLVHGLRAQLGFFYIRNLNIRNFKCLDGQSYQFLIYIVTWEHLRIENVELAGDKDGIKLSNGHDAIINDVNLNTYDDGLSLCGTDYPSVCVEAGDVYNVRCTNIHDQQYKNIFGRTFLILTGSWADYQNGNEYGSGDFCLSQGKLYQCVNKGGFLGIASSPPSHDNGISAGSDKISWRFVQSCSFLQTNVYNITFDNCVFEKSGNIIANWITPSWHYRKFNGVHRPFYPGTEKHSRSWGISVCNCRINAKAPQVLVNLMGNMNDLSISNCYFSNPQITVLNVDEESSNEKLIMSINNCIFNTVKNDCRQELPDHQNCPILLCDIKETGKIIVINNGGKICCNATGNLYCGDIEQDCSMSNGSHIQFY